MSSPFVALLVVLSITIILFVVVFLNNRSKRIKTGKLLRRFSELGTHYNLSFTGQEVLGNRVIGVDGLKGNVLFLEHSDTNPVCSIIDLTETKSCRVSKLYSSFNAGNSSEKCAEGYLHTIALEFDFMKSAHTVALPFYNHASDSIQDAAEMEAKAKNWESVLLKMMQKNGSGRSRLRQA